MLKSGEVFSSKGRIYDELELKDENKKKSKISFKQIEKVDFYLFNKKKNSIDTLSLYSIKLSEKKYKLALKIYESNKIAIYGVILPGGAGSSLNGGSVSVGNFSNYNYSNAGAIAEYYTHFKAMDKMEVLYFSYSLSGFKTMASNCFKACESLVEKIKNKEFKLENINEIGEYYTNTCN